ncbi:MAG TPA: ABC transporter ATP-binding protein [Candidatus Enterocloster excrementigallinarum]|uniref:ABC transporter ATP-binding protein n=1 Tax=Candidatus Enterocloster excrementigallinarum TaxID=2838558 RepID=A0A9D2PTR2_9FIRM|nr:ABC transporter ATP-binding protein [Candidatus Enterocloster excrementigallinarum]
MSLHIQQVTKSFNKTQALKEINLDIKDSEFVAILGPSGCGKTTLLRIVGGFIEPTSGIVRLNDQIYSGQGHMVPVEKRDLGMVFQSFALWPHMTVRQHVEFPLKSPRHKGMSPEEKAAAVEQAISCTGLKPYENRLPGELSGGQRQRVALARAIVGKPSILLMDEPLSALDAELKIEMRREIQNIHKLTGATILYVTHDQSEALAMADRIIIMKDGAVEQVGTPREIYMDPQTVFAATFVSRCNLLKGSWHGDSFRINNENILLRNPMIPAEFRSKGLYPVRPEQLTIQPEGEGIPGVIANKQYNGREIHYSIQYRDEILTVYTSCQTEYNPGDHISLTLSA